jgi:hypothetical protein
LGGFLLRTPSDSPGEAPADFGPRVETGWNPGGGDRSTYAVQDGRSWTVQPLPSGSLKKTNEFQGPPGPFFCTPSS